MFKLDVSDPLVFDHVEAGHIPRVSHCSKRMFFCDDLQVLVKLDVVLDVCIDDLIKVELCALDLLSHAPVEHSAMVVVQPVKVNCIVGSLYFEIECSQTEVYLKGNYHR